jgi:hypothetical protein
MALQPGELGYLVVATQELPGTPSIACRNVQVSLELATPEHHEALRGEGLAAMRRRVLCAANRSASLLDRVFPTVGLRSAHECRSAGSWDGYRTCSRR